MRDLLAGLEPSPPPVQFITASDALRNHPTWPNSIFRRADERGVLTSKMLADRRDYYLLHYAVLSERERQQLQLLEQELERLT